MLCRFEDRLAGRALRLDGLRRRIEARAAAEVGPALQAIEAERRQGRWVALMLDYELGEWLPPEAARGPRPTAPWDSTPPADDGRPRWRAGHRRQDRRRRRSALDSPIRPGRARAQSATLTPAAPSGGRGRLPAPHRRDPRPRSAPRAVPGQLHPAAGSRWRYPTAGDPPPRAPPAARARRAHPETPCAASARRERRAACTAAASAGWRRTAIFAERGDPHAGRGRGRRRRLRRGRRHRP